MSGYPVTHGYTINIVKDRTKSAAVILYNQKKAVSEPIFLAVPSGPAVVPEPETEPDHHPVPEPQTEEKPSESEVYFEPVNFDSNSVGFFTEIAHEEVVEEEVLCQAERQMNVEAPSNLPVHCDLCNSKLLSTDEAKLHMKTVHNVLTYDGPFFKCDFCGLLVTDRVSHMKQAHYSPLNGAFTKASSGYQCRQCDYVSDQLTNIRNHVDAKHNNGLNKYVCEECKSVYKTLNSMRAHKSRVHVKKRKQEEKGVQNKRESKILKKVDSNQKQRLEKEILELELKTLPSIVSRTNEANKYYLL